MKAKFKLSIEAELETEIEADTLKEAEKIIKDDTNFAKYYFDGNIDNIKAAKIVDYELLGLTERDVIIDADIKWKLDTELEKEMAKYLPTKITSLSVKDVPIDVDEEDRIISDAIFNYLNATEMLEAIKKDLEAAGITYEEPFDIPSYQSDYTIISEQNTDEYWEDYWN